MDGNELLTALDLEDERLRFLADLEGPDADLENEPERKPVSDGGDSDSRTADRDR